MRTNEELKNMEANEALVNEAQETTEMVEVKKKGLLARFMALKTWQKVAVVTLLVGTVAGGTFVIIKLINSKPEAVAAAIDTVTSEAPEVISEVVDEAKIVNF